jgi:hypothetical protein
VEPSEWLLPSPRAEMEVVVVAGVMVVAEVEAVKR